MTDYALLVLGLVLLVVGYVAGIGVLVTLGWIGVGVGLLLAILALAGRSPFRSRTRR